MTSNGSLHAALVILLGLLSAAYAKRALAPAPWVIAHRGASGLLPEHTLEAYQLAIDQVPEPASHVRFDRSLLASSRLRWPACASVKRLPQQLVLLTGCALHRVRCRADQGLPTGLPA